MNPPAAEGLDVAYVARLARLELTPEETRQFQAQLGEIMAYVHQLREADLAGIEPTAHAVPIENVFRADEPRPGLPREEVLARAPAVVQEQFLVPRILE